MSQPKKNSAYSLLHQPLTSSWIWSTETTRTKNRRKMISNLSCIITLSPYPNSQARSSSTKIKRKITSPGLSSDQTKLRKTISYETTRNLENHQEATHTQIRIKFPHRTNFLCLCLKWCFSFNRAWWEPARWNWKEIIQRWTYGEGRNSGSRARKWDSGRRVRWVYRRRKEPWPFLLVDLSNSFGYFAVRCAPPCRPTCCRCSAHQTTGGVGPYGQPNPPPSTTTQRSLLQWRTETWISEASTSTDGTKYAMRGEEEASNAERWALSLSGAVVLIRSLKRKNKMKRPNSNRALPPHVVLSTVLWRYGSVALLFPLCCYRLDWIRLESKIDQPVPYSTSKMKSSNMPSSWVIDGVWCLFGVDFFID